MSQDLVALSLQIGSQLVVDQNKNLLAHKAKIAQDLNIIGNADIQGNVTCAQIDPAETLSVGGSFAGSVEYLENTDTVVPILDTDKMISAITVTGTSYPETTLPDGTKTGQIKIVKYIGGIRPLAIYGNFRTTASPSFIYAGWARVYMWSDAVWTVISKLDIIA